MKQATLHVKDIAVGVNTVHGKDYISLTDIARSKNPAEPKDVVKNRLLSRETIEFPGLWEQLNNPDFKGVEIDPFLYVAGSNAFTLSPSKWIASTNAIGLISRAGRNGGEQGGSKNLRDEATLEQLIVLSNLESVNAVFIRQQLSQPERLAQLKAIAIVQLTSLVKNNVAERLRML